MTILEELIDYAHKCINDVRANQYEDYISCQKHKWACERFLKDIEKSKLNILKEPFNYYWNEEEASKIVKWFSYLRHSKGVLAGQPIILNTWQKFNVCQLYGWRNKKTEKKRFKTSFIEVARKNAKSQMEAGIALYEISSQSTKNREVYEYYTAGTKRDQSKIIVNEAKLMLKGSPLRGKFKITRDLIEHVKTGSFIKALCKEDGQKGDGTNPAGLILDEYHQHKSTEFYDLFLGANTKEPLLMIITTAGKDLTYPCFTQEYKYCSNILDPNVEEVVNDEYLVDICELDKEDYRELTNISNERLWLKANPIRMTYEDGWNKIKDQFRIALDIPEKMTAFLTKCLNIWVQAQENSYMDMSKWKLCEVKQLPIDITGMTVYVGFDMSAKIDLTSVAFVIPFLSEELDKEGNKIVKYIVFSHSFIPNREKLAERIAKDKVPYDTWVRQKYITITDTPIVDQNAVIKYVLEFCEKYRLNIECLCFDPANASKIMIDLSDKGFNVEEVFQSHKSLNESTQGFREQTYCKNIIYIYNPVLNFAMSNAVIKTNNGLIKIDKDATEKKIDPVDAILCGFKLALYHQFIDIKSTDEWLESDEW
ncbi:terminase large subunit [Clostridium botulinum]|uniref:Terminase large subunit n=1 Tax=Clostridium botulinum TaxID=1491 RepID=A0A6B4MZF4_CLOBO|nr:terminase TerL endonuclease subunit [Clostridium botulinum]EES48212.1 putative phage terminase, large subunit [Clostridium botulinum E1 str. 'BoNT E Beluga']MBY6760569.1 terminase large subunit [Clostridium botulinum]MBY6919476.1 terminase large subunit [Clostridium botulinum]MCR1130354.1 terminase large subunit [Clostridium botulinum]NFJ56891.1 terminase large subunit [Clostridium botulinum]